VINPAAFGGTEAFERQTSFIAAAARASPPVAGGTAVRTPGQAALAHKVACLANGVELYPGTMAVLVAAAGELGVTGLPRPL
jgi:L-lactate dehydrogenase